MVMHTCVAKDVSNTELPMMNSAAHSIAKIDDNKKQTLSIDLLFTTSSPDYILILFLNWPPLLFPFQNSRGKLDTFFPLEVRCNLPF